MKTSEIWDLIEFLNANITWNEWNDLTFRSKSFSEYEIVAECIEDDDNEVQGTHVWKLAINSVPYDENRMTDWLEDRDDLCGIPPHYYEGAEMAKISKYDDWALEPESWNELLTSLREAKDKAMKPWDKMISLVGSCDLYVFEYPEEDEND